MMYVASTRSRTTRRRVYLSSTMNNAACREVSAVHCDVVCNMFFPITDWRQTRPCVIMKTGVGTTGVACAICTFLNCQLGAIDRAANRSHVIPRRYSSHLHDVAQRAIRTRCVEAALLLSWVCWQRFRDPRCVSIWFAHPLGCAWQPIVLTRGDVGQAPGPIGRRQYRTVLYRRATHLRPVPRAQCCDRYGGTPQQPPVQR